MVKKKSKLLFSMEGKPIQSEVDKSFYTDDHDVPVTRIGGLIINLGWDYELDKDAVLDPTKEYCIEIWELTNNGEDTQS